jgi:hypothetical protein
MASVAVGLFAGLFVLGLYQGIMRERVRTVIDTEVAHLQIHHPQFKEDYDPIFILDENRIKLGLEKINGIRAVANRSVTQGMLATTTGSSGVQINGIDSQEETEVSQMKGKIQEGEELDPSKKNGILIGKKLADKMKLKIGYFFSDSREGIKTQVWIVLIANLIFSVIHKKIKEAEQFTTLVAMAKANLISYICFQTMLQTRYLNEEQRNLEIVQLDIF